MHILWKYLQPLRWWVAPSLLLAATAQLLTLVDPLIFGIIIDRYALNPEGMSDAELVRGALGWLLLAAAVALAARLAKTFQDYVVALVVQKFGMRIFNDGLRQTLRLSFQEFEDRTSGETMAMLQKVRNDTERFINAFVNILFTSVVGIGFLLWYGITKHWLLIPVFGIGVVVLGGLTGLLGRTMKSIQRMIVRETTRMSGAITESLRNIEPSKPGLTYPEIRRLHLHTGRIFEPNGRRGRYVRCPMQGAIINTLAVHPVHPAVADLSRRAHHRRADRDAVHPQCDLRAAADLGRIILSYREAEASMLAFDEPCGNLSSVRRIPSRSVRSGLR